MPTRRAFVGGAIAALGSFPLAALEMDMGRLLPIRGTRLYVDDTGPRDAPALLYLHGGPGAGSYDFQFYQRARLNGLLRLVALDQRGVLRSDPTGPMSVQDLVEDCEAVRHALGIQSWHVLGHSFGGQVAVRYAVAHPSSLRSVLFENPSFSVASSVRSLLHGAREIAVAEKRKDVIVAINEVTAISQSARQYWDAFGRIGGMLGPNRDDLYVHQPELRGFFERLQESSGLGDEAWRRASGQVAALLHEGSMFDDFVPWLRHIRCPALLLHGRYDLVTAADQCEAFLKSGRDRALEMFGDSGHFVHVEEPDAFARSVIGFIQSGDRATCSRALSGIMSENRRRSSSSAGWAGSR